MLDSMLRTKGIDSKIDICLGLRLDGEKGKVGFPWPVTLDKDSVCIIPVVYLVSWLCFIIKLVFVSKFGIYRIPDLETLYVEKQVLAHLPLRLIP